MSSNKTIDRHTLWLERQRNTMKLFQGLRDRDDPGSIESIERRAEKQRKSEKKQRDKPATVRDIPRLCRELLMQNSNSESLREAQEAATKAAKKLYELCDVGHKSNREIMVASGQYDVVGPLTQCLVREPIYQHGVTTTVSSPSRVTLPQQQQPRIEGDGMSNNSSHHKPKKASENGHPSPSSSSSPISPSSNGEKANDDETSDQTSTATISKPSAEGSTNSGTVSATTTTTPLDNNDGIKPISSVRKKQSRVDETLHFVCLTLNNLSIPHDNKRVMVRERGARRLIRNLCTVIASGKKESHLCCIILMNLTFYEPGLTIIGQFSPTPKKTILRKAAAAVTNQPKLPPLENPDSLLRILQDLISSRERGTSDFRWAFGLLANLSRHPENALLIGLTGIPRVAVENIRLSQTPSTEWATNSLEDFSLYFLLHLAEASSQGLQGAREVAVPIMNGKDFSETPRANAAVVASSNGQDAKEGQANSNGDASNNDVPKRNSIKNCHLGGIQSLKATMICALLGLEWKDFPDHGVIAAGTVSELMGNTFERVGKKQVYTDNDFALRTAVSAYAALAKAAAKADSGNKSSPKNAASTNGASKSSSSSSCEHTKVMALPTSVALLFQIINAIALHWGEDNNIMTNNSGHNSSGNAESSSSHTSAADAYHWDIKAGELAVTAIMYLLPALLEGTGEEPPKPSMATQQACADLSKIFVFFSKKTNSISVKARAAEVAEKLTHAAFGNALPLLEASYDLCRNFGTHKLQKNFL